MGTQLSCHEPLQGAKAMRHGLVRCIYTPPAHMPQYQRSAKICLLQAVEDALVVPEASFKWEVSRLPLSLANYLITKASSWAIGYEFFYVIPMTSTLSPSQPDALSH